MKIFYLCNVKIEPLTPSPRLSLPMNFHPRPVTTVMSRKYSIETKETLPSTYRRDLIKNFYLYRQKFSDPLPPLSLHSKDRKFSPGFLVLHSIPGVTCYLSSLGLRLLKGLSICPTVEWAWNAWFIKLGLSTILTELLICCV